MHHCQINNLCIIWVYVRSCCSFNFKTDIDISVSFRFSMTVSGLSYKDFLKKFNHCSNVKYYHYCCKENINVILLNHPPNSFSLYGNLEHLSALSYVHFTNYCIFSKHLSKVNNNLSIKNSMYS